MRIIEKIENKIYKINWIGILDNICTGGIISVFSIATISSCGVLIWCMYNIGLYSLLIPAFICIFYFIGKKFNRYLSL